MTLAANQSVPTRDFIPKDGVDAFTFYVNAAGSAEVVVSRRDTDGTLHQQGTSIVVSAGIELPIPINPARRTVLRITDTSGADNAVSIDVLDVE